ncbi:MAG: ComF family protein [Pseudomonadota bacterium]
MGPSSINIRAFARRLFHQTGDFLLPPTCLACDTTVSRQGSLCPKCWQEARFIEKPFCAVLGSPFAYDLGEGALSARAIAERPRFNAARAVMLYEDVARRLVLGLKFSHRTDLAPWMAKLMVRAADGLLADNPLIVPVPLHTSRMVMRRFNQAAELARAIAREEGLTYAPEMLVRTRATKQQVRLGRRERANNVSGAFQVPKGQRPWLKGRKIVLVDDVFTTGATLEACTRALLRSGAAQVNCLTFARVANGVAVHEI